MFDSISDKTGIVTTRIGKENHYALDIWSGLLNVSSSSLQSQYIIDGLWSHIGSLDLQEMLRKDKAQREADLNHLIRLERQIRQNR